MNDSIAASVARLQATGHAPRIAIVLGSGWGGAAARVQDAVDVPYAELPAFPELHVAGHTGTVRLGRFGGQPVALLAGRKHTYETGDASAMKGAIRTLAAFGVQVLVQTNAAGSLDAAIPPGALMLVNDHLNLPQRSPLVGETGNGRFVDMGAAYCPRLRAQAQRGAGTPLAEGVYAWALGPQFETPAEIRMMKLLGASAVGMSTVPETILARHAGMRVLALSLMTNMAAGLAPEVLSHEHTMATAAAAGERAVAVLESVVAALEA